MLEQKLRTLVRIVEETLGEDASYMTKKVLTGVKENLKNGQFSDHDADQLAHWYAKDFAFLYSAGKPTVSNPENPVVESNA